MKSLHRDLLIRLDAEIQRRREHHPEFGAPLTWLGFRRILEREQVELVVKPHPRLGELLPLLGRWMIIIDQNAPVESRTLTGSHELAHLWLHHDPYFDRHETHVYDSGCPWYDERRELEANLFAELLVAGPCQEISGKRGHVAAALPTNARPANSAVTLPGVATIPADAFDQALERQRAIEEQSRREKAEHRVVRRRAKNAASSIFTGKQVSDRRTADDEQLKFFDESRGLPRFRDDGGMHWWVSNYNEAGERVRDFMSLEIVTRVFENAAGVRKVYRFPDARERRELAVKHLERQLREARTLS